MQPEPHFGTRKRKNKENTDRQDQVKERRELLDQSAELEKGHVPSGSARCVRWLKRGNVMVPGYCATTNFGNNTNFPRLYLSRKGRGSHSGQPHGKRAALVKILVLHVQYVIGAHNISTKRRTICRGHEFASQGSVRCTPSLVSSSVVLTTSNTISKCGWPWSWIWTPPSRSPTSCRLCPLSDTSFGGLVLYGNPAFALVWG